MKFLRSFSRFQFVFKITSVYDLIELWLVNQLQNCRHSIVFVLHFSESICRLHSSIKLSADWNRCDGLSSVIVNRQTSSTRRWTNRFNFMCDFRYPITWGFYGKMFVFATIWIYNLLSVHWMFSAQQTEEINIKLLVSVRRNYAGDNLLRGYRAGDLVLSQRDQAVIRILVLHRLSRNKTRRSPTYQISKILALLR